MIVYSSYHVDGYFCESYTITIENRQYGRGHYFTKNDPKHQKHDCKAILRNIAIEHHNNIGSNE